MPLDLPEPHQTNAMCARLAGWKNLRVLDNHGYLVGSGPPGGLHDEFGTGVVPNYCVSATACASLLPALMPKIKEWWREPGKVLPRTEWAFAFEQRLLLALSDGDQPEFCRLVLEAVRKVSEKEKSDGKS